VTPAYAGPELFDGLIAPSSGRLLFKNRDVSKLSARERRAWFMKEVQPIFQDPFAAFSPLKSRDSSNLNRREINNITLMRRLADNVTINSHPTDSRFPEK